MSGSTAFGFLKEVAADRGDRSHKEKSGMRIAKLCALGATIFAVAAPAFAQGPGGGFRGGRGGFGGPGMLLRMPEVQKELKLEAAQTDLLNQFNQESREKGQAMFQELQNASPEERQKRMEAFRLDQEKKLGEILDAKQMARLKQLELQQQGNRALGRKEVADTLKLTPDQRQRIQAAMDGEREAMRAMFQGFQGGQDMTQEQRQEAFKKFGEVRTATDTKLAAILTPAQKTQFTSMQGPAFKFPEFRGFGGRRGGAGAGN
jgi:hypothetical protein